jgi:hypothetical protein
MTKLLRPAALALACSALAAPSSACKRNPPEPTATVTIGADECDKWAAHGSGVIVGDWRDAASKCGPSVREPLASKVESQKGDMRRALADVCKKHVGETVPAVGPSCYMASSTVKDMAGCHFAAMVNPADADLPNQLAQLRATCAKQAGGDGGAAPSASSTR